MAFIVHTQRITDRGRFHFFYQVNARAEEAAYGQLVIQGAVERDETHVETFPVIEGDRSHELIAIIKTR